MSNPNNPETLPPNPVDEAMVSANAAQSAETRRLFEVSPRTFTIATLGLLATSETVHAFMSGWSNRASTSEGVFSAVMHKAGRIFDRFTIL